jgi:integrase/recombinase XerD
MVIWERQLNVEGWHSTYPSVDQYLKHYGRKTRSERTRKNCLHALSLFCRYAATTPDALLALAPREASATVQRFLDAKHDAGASIRYVNVLRAFLQVFFRVNGFKNSRALDVEGYHQPARYRKTPEYIPSRDELYRMAYAAGSKRNQALVLVTYTSGLRNSTLRALRYKDVNAELAQGFDVVKIPVYPAMKDVDPGACKGNIPYYTFIAKEAVTALNTYLAEREAIQGEEPLFCSATTNIPRDVRRTIRIKSDTLGAVVKRAARRAGIAQWRHVTPHGLRKAFDSALRNGGVDVSDREFLMGHILSGSQDTYYDRSKIDELRRKYAVVQFFGTRDLDRVAMVKAFAASLGIANIEIKIAKLQETDPHLTDDEAVGRMVKEELIQAMTVRTSRRRTTTEVKKIVTEDALARHLSEGWDIQTILPSGNIVVTK